MMFTITANGTEMGTYEAADRNAAVLAYVQDAGYDSVAAAAEVLGKTEEEFVAELHVA